MNQFPQETWDITAMAKRLYVAEDAAEKMLKDLAKIGICKQHPQEREHFVYAPKRAELNQMITELADFYASNLIEVTNMVHSKAHQGKRVHLFADAFKFNEDK
ncbi:hypothetical protein [Cellvibrio sp.]|uniref:hypothetical protein n=1 Tax=Cellvibrio sp. TaxID=1965322 RepID=UPI0039648BF0